MPSLVGEPGFRARNSLSRIWFCRGEIDPSSANVFWKISLAESKLLSKRVTSDLLELVLWALMVDIMSIWAGKLYKGLSAPNRDKIFPGGWTPTR